MNAEEVQRRLDSAYQELSRTNSDLMQMTLELDDRVAERTAELVAANEALRREIEERRRMEALLREQAELIDKANEIIITGDSSRAVKFLNPTAQALLGWTTEEVRGRPLLEVLSLEAGAGDQLDEEILLRCEDWRGEVWVRNRSGRSILLEMSLTVLRGTGGDVTGHLTISLDVTDRKRLEEQLLRSQRLESLGVLAAGIAHDLNNVLNPISLSVHILQERATQPRELQLLRTIGRCVQNGTDLVRQIVAFARGTSGPPQEVSVQRILLDIQRIAATFPRSIDSKFEIAEDLGKVMGNPTEIHQVLLNLCVNARDAMVNGGTLTLRAWNVASEDPVEGVGGSRRRGPWVVISVEDTGTGISKEVLSRIWEPFFTTKPMAQGTGLGLSTARGIMESHGGLITVGSELGVGTTFRVYLKSVHVGGRHNADA